MRLRPLALLALLSSLQGGCAFYWSGKDQWERTRRDSVRAEESDAALSCGESPCAAANVQRSERQGHDQGVFWAVSGVELATFVGVMAPTNGSAPTLLAIPAWLGLGLFIGDLLLGSIGYVSGGMGEHQGEWALSAPVRADWSGARVPISLADVVPMGADALPASFSVRKAAERSGVELRAPGEARAQVVKAGSGSLAVFDLLQTKGSKAEADWLDAPTRHRLTEAIRGVLVNGTSYEVWSKDALTLRCDALHLPEPADCMSGDPLQIGARLGAAQVLSSNAVRSGGGVLVTLRLSDVQSGQTLASKTLRAASIAELDARIARGAAELVAAATGGQVPVAAPEKKRLRIAVPDFVAKGAGFDAADLVQLGAAARAAIQDEGAGGGEVEAVAGGQAAEETLSGEVLKFGSTLRGTVRLSRGSDEGQTQAVSGKSLEELRSSVRDAVRKLVAGSLPAGASR